MEVVSKRFHEISDPSVSYTVAADVTTGTPKILVKAAANSTVDRKLMVNNWLGFLSTCSCPCPDTNDLNTVEIEITFADEKVLWASADATKVSDPPAVGGGSWYLDDVHFTIAKIVFNDPLYYNLKAV